MAAQIASWLVLAAVMAVTQPALAQERIKVVATFSILGDLVKNVAGERATIQTLVGADGDAHVYAPSPSDAKTLTEAKVIFANGLGFEGWITRLVKASGTKAVVVIATRGIKPRRTAAGAHGHGEAHSHGDADPHAWQAVPNAKIYVANIRDGLMQADPGGRAAYESNASAYLAKLDALEQEIRDAVARVPAERRRIITTHDAFGYFNAAYGIDFVAPQGVSTDSEASARDVARIIMQIRKQKISAVFLENVSDSRLIKRIADETGAKIGGTLYSDALTAESGPAPTYLDMMRHNIRTLSAALMS